MIKSKAGQIAPYQLFFILFVSRVVVTLTYLQTVSVGKLSTDLVISIIISLGLSLLMSVPAYLCSVKGRNPFYVKWLAILYAIYFVFFSALNVGRFSYFATSRLTPESSVAFFVAAIMLCACYAAVMGIEGIGRFGVFCGIILVLTALMVIIFNAGNINGINLFPIIDNTGSDIIKNSIVITSNSVEPAIFLALEGKVNGDKKKPLFLGITASYAVIVLLILLCQLVMGSASSLQSYPVFTLFQLASAGSMSRLDIFHTAFWVLALFLKASVLILCASMCVKRFSHRTKCIALSLLSAVVALLVTDVSGMDLTGFTKIISLVLFGVYVVIIPVLSIIFIRKSRVDSIVEKISD